MSSSRSNCFLLFAVLSVVSCRTLHAFPWFPFGPYGGDARAFAADPKDHAHLFLGTANGWVYESHDGGAKWARLNRVDKRDDLVVDNMLVDPVDSKHLVVGAWVLDHPDGGLYNSLDGGNTWSSVPEMRGQSIRSLTESPSNPGIMIAGSLKGVFRSSDSGAHWLPISPKDDKEIHEVEALAIDPKDPMTIYAGTWHLAWKTVDGGEKWSPIKAVQGGFIEDSDVFSIIVDPEHPEIVYASACSGIYKSVDKGGNFIKVQGIPSTARRTRVLMQDPKHLDTVFAGTTEGLWRSDDAGKNWLRTTGSEVVVNDVYIDPTDPRHLLIAIDHGGVRMSDDGGDSFVPSNSGFSTRQITAYATDRQQPARVYVGVVNDKEWGGVFKSETGGQTWVQLSAGLEGRDVFSLTQAPDGTMLAGTSHGIYRLKDGEWDREAETNMPDRPQPIRKAPQTVAERHAAAAARARAAKPVPDTVPKSFDGSVYGFTLSGDRLFAATSKGILRSATSGTSWSLVSGLPDEEWRFMAASTFDVAAASLSKLLLSRDGGNAWKPVPLPETLSQIAALALDAQGRIWVGGREGVFYSDASGGAWQRLDNLFVRNVNSIFYDQPNDRLLITSTGPSTYAFEVKMPTMLVHSWDTGWNLRFVRPMPGYMLAGTLFDGIVVQPAMVDSAVSAVR